MCEFSQRLIIWLDGELAAGESAVVERHVRSCVECQNAIATYRALDETIGAYCEVAMVSKAEKRERVKRRPWRLAFVGTAAAAAIVLVVLVGKSVQRSVRIDSPAANGVPAIAMSGHTDPPAAMEKVPIAQSLAGETTHPARKHVASPRSAPVIASPRNSENLWPNQAPVYIAIPADALFPPGALPEGFVFVADVNLRPDGSAQRLRLQPQLVGFQRRGAQP